MAIFIIQAETTTGTTKFRLIDEINEIYIIWSRDVNQEANIVLDVNLTVGTNIIINHCFDTSDNVWKTETQPINNKIPSQTITITRQEQNTIIHSSEKTSDYIDAEIQKVVQSIASIDTIITANKVMNVIENTPNSTIFAFAEDNKLYFQSNQLDYNIQYVDTDFVTTTLTYEQLSTFAGIISSIALTGTTNGSDYYRSLNTGTSYVYILRDNFDVLFYDVKFGACRAVEYWALKDGTTEVFTGKYKYLFACNLDTSNLSEDFINVRFLKCAAQSASPSFTDNTFETTSVFNTNTASTVARATIKYPTTCFRIKLNNFPIIAFPLTTSRVVSSSTGISLDDFSFYVNNSAFLFCNRTEIDKMYNFMNQDNIINWHEASNQTLTFDEDILEGQIYNLYLTNNNPESQTVANIVNIKIARKVLETPKSFTLRLICNVGLASKTINLIDAEQGTPSFPILTNFPTTYFTYTTTSDKPIEFLDISCIYKRAPVIGGGITYMLSMTAPKIVKDITYYDWTYKQGVADKSSLMRASTSLNPLTTAQYAQFNANRPIRITQNINGGDTLILQNLKMYYLRGSYSYYSTATSSTPVYTTSQYKDNCTINITISNPTTPSLVILDKVAFQNVRPVGNNKMFPLTTASTTNYKIASGAEPLSLLINGNNIFSLTNTNNSTYKDYVFSWKRTIISNDGTLLAIASPLVDVQNGTINTSTTTSNTGATIITITPSIDQLIFVPLNNAIALGNRKITVNMPSFVNNPDFNTTFKSKIRFSIYNFSAVISQGYIDFTIFNNSGFASSTYITYISPSEFNIARTYYNEYVEFELIFTANGLTTPSNREKWIVNITSQVKSW